jgi:rSAM/selenodomain-associated transferase 2
MKFSIIIPTFNEKNILSELRSSLRPLVESGTGGVEVILSDGHSEDGTPEIAASYGWRTIGGERGRGRQMNAGAALAQGEILVFLHADTQLPAAALTMISGALRDPRVVGGNFKLKFAGKSREAAWLTRIYPLLRLGGMCYGDSGFFIRREIFTAIGGFRDYPIFEDCDLYRRVSRIGEFRTLSGAATTSSRRFEGRFLRTLLLWITLQCLYWLGISPHRLGKFYRACR